MKKKWKRVVKDNATKIPVEKEIWGYCTNLEEVLVCNWEGDKGAYGTPLIKPKVSLASNDHNIQFWMEKEPTPDPPNVEVD